MPKRTTIRLIPQKGSPLGTKRHVQAVERRLAAGLPGAYSSGALRYLTPEALKEERRRLERERRNPAPPARGRLDPIQREIAGVGFLGKVQ